MKVTYKQNTLSYSRVIIDKILRAVNRVSIAETSINPGFINQQSLSGRTNHSSRPNTDIIQNHINGREDDKRNDG